MWWWCGRGSLRSIVVEEGKVGSALNLSSLNKSKKKKKKKKAEKDNPYSSLGLDKFSALLSNLEAQRRSIEAESEDMPTTILWFRFTESNDCVPIFQRLKNDTKEAGRREMSSEPQSAPAEHAEVNEASFSEEIRKEMGIKKVEGWSWKDWASAYSPLLLLALVLICLMFSRVFAIYCATIWWYLVPRIRGKDPRRKSRRLMRKKSVIV